MKNHFIKQNKAASVTEYGILAGLVGVVAITSLVYLGSDVSNSFETASDSLISARNTQAVEADNNEAPAQEESALVDESLLNCVTDEAGYDSFQENDGGRGSYTFPGDCLLVTTDGDVTFVTLDSLHPGQDFYARINTSPAAETSSLSFTGGGNHTVLVEQGPVSVDFPDSTGQVHLPGVDTQRDFMRMVGQRGFITTAVDGSQMSFDMLYVDPATGLVGPSSDVTFHFADQTLTSSQLKSVVFEKMTTSGNDAIDGTDTVDVIYLNEGGMDNLDLYGGDDEVHWTSGSFDIRSTIVESLDTLYVPNVSVNDVTTSVDGYDYLLTLPSGESARILFANITSGTKKGIDRIVFSDDTIDETEIDDFFIPAP